MNLSRVSLQKNMRAKHLSYAWILVVLFFTLCLTWTFNGVWLFIGRGLTPLTPGLLGTGIFIILALLIFYLPERVTIVDLNRFRGLSLVTLAGILVFYLLQYRLGQSTPAFAETPIFIFNLLVAGLAWIGWARGWNVLASILILGIVVQVMIYNFVSLAFADVPAMLHWVAQANQNLLAGVNPYAAGELNYFPGLWLPYLLVAFQGDPRMLNLLLFPMLVAGSFALSRQLMESKPRDLFYLATCGCVILFLNPGVIHEIVKDQVLPDLFYIGLFAAGLIFSLPIPSAVGLGLSIAARQTSLVLLPLAFLEFLRMFTRGYKYFGLLLLVSGSLILPFLAWNVDAFVHWTFAYNQQWYMDRWLLDRAQANAFSLAPIFYAFGNTQWLQPLQALAVGIFTFSFFRQRSQRTSVVVRRFGLVYFTFLLLNPIIWNYYYLQFFILVLTFLFARFAETSTESLHSKQVVA